MTAQHTTGRLVASTPAKDDPLLNQSQSMCLLSNGRALFTAHWKNHGADARRLAACWNYFGDSISTEAIEADSYAQVRSSFIGQRDALERARANLAYYQGVMCLPGAPQYWVQGGNEVPAVTPVRVAELVEKVAAMAIERDQLLAEARAIEANYEAARALLVEMLEDAEESYMDSWGQRLESYAAVKVRAFLKGGAT